MYFMDDWGIGFWIFLLVLCILNLILFYKIWMMTSDVNSIKRILQGETVDEVDNGTTKIILGTVVFLLVVIVFFSSAA